MAEPMCCVLALINASTVTPYVYEHRMGVKPAVISRSGLCGPMGIGAIDYAINGGIQPARLWW